MANFEAWTIEGKFDGTNWVDFYNDIVSDVECAYGIQSNNALVRIADIGEMSFTLNNSETNSAQTLGYYSLGHPNCRAGFYPGMEVRATFTLSGGKKQKWIGRIALDGIKIQTGTTRERRVDVAVRDWMEQLSNHELQGMAFAQNLDTMAGAALVIANMDIQPPGTTDYRTAETTFSYLFDTALSNTTAISEISKMLDSELGYMYPTRAGLRIEGRLTRNEEKTALDEYPKALTDCDTLVNEDGDYIVNEDGDTILINESTTAIFDNVQNDADVSLGTNYYNSVKFTAYPRRVDAAATTILFNLQSPMEIKSGETITISGRYKDPTGVAKSVSALTSSMVTPVGGTHYSCFANKDGSGANLTANLTVTPIFGTGEFSYAITNSGADGWITMCKAVGKGIYTDQPISYSVEDSAQIALYGRRPLTLDMKYQDDASVARYWAAVKLAQYSSLVPSIDSITMYANRNDAYLYAFLYIEPGDRIRIKEDVTGINSDFFVQGVRFTMMQGGLLKFTWIVKPTGLDTWNFAKWIADDVTIPTYGTWDDTVYGWEF